MMTIDLTQDKVLQRRLRNYRWESDRAFRKMSKRIANELHVYYELLMDSDGGAYRLVKKRDVL